MQNTNPSQRFIPRLMCSLCAGKSAPWWLWALAAIGALLLAHAAYLVLFYSMLHFGIMLISAIGACFIAVWWWARLQGWAACRAWLHGTLWRLWVWRLAWASFVLWLLSVVVFFVLIASGHSLPLENIAHSNTQQVILILGGGAPRCKVSPAVQTRLDKGIAIAQRLPHATVMVTGGKNILRNCTEGQIMGDYLRSNGIAPSRIVQEERSTSTHENLLFSATILQQQGFDKTQDTLIIVTHEFHALRARYIAYKQGFKQVASENAITPLYARYVAWLREYFTYISGFLLQEI